MFIAPIQGYRSTSGTATSVSAAAWPLIAPNDATGYVQFTNTSQLIGDATNVLALRNGTSSQTYRIYETFTDASNYSRFFIRFTTNRFEVGTEAAGTGNIRPIQLFTNNTVRWEIGSTTGHLIAQNAAYELRTDLIKNQAGTAGRINMNATGLAFFDATPVARAAAYTQTYATASRTHSAITSADIGVFTGGVVAFLDTAERDNIRTQYNALRAEVINLKQVVNSLIDDSQGIGVAQ